jgi:hypothetical protein
MNLKDMLAKMSQLSEAIEKTKTGVRHTAEPGGYGRKDDEDEEGNRVKQDTAPRGRGRPKKTTATSGEDKKYDFSAFGVKAGKDIKLPAHDKKKTTKHSIKEYIDQLEKALTEADQIEIKPASQMPKKPGQPSQPGQQQGQQGQQGQQAQNAQVIAQGDKTLGTVNNPQLAQQIKQSIGKGEMTLMPDQQVNELDAGTVARYQDKAFDKYMGGDEKRAQGLDRASKKQAGAFGHVPTTQKVNEKDIGKHNNATTGFDAMVRKLTPKYGAEAAKRIAGAQLKKIREADMPPNDSLSSPLSLEEGKKSVKKDDKAEKAGKKVTKDLEYDMKHKGKDDAKAEKAGKKVTKDIEYDEKKKKTVKEAAKPDFPDIDDDDNTKESIKKAAADKKKKVKEGMDHRLKAARHMGKAHALTKEGYNCRYDDMEESRHYHEGYKEGLDECYGQMPVQGLVVGETGMPAATVPGMASQAMDNDVMEVGRSDYMKQQAKSTPGDTFKAFGQTFRDKEVVESPFAFEAWDKELNALLEGKVDEGMTVSISKGQQGSPDSVSVTAQDGEADQLLQVIKQAGLGLFGSDDAGTSGQSSSMSLQPADGGPEGGEMGIDVVDDHDGMMNLIRKVTGAQPAPATQGFGGDEGSSDYEDEEGHDDHEHDHSNEETCNECGGMMEAGHECGEGQQMVDEVESEDQMEYEVAEEIDPNNSDEENEENSDAVRDAALATASSTNEEEQVDEDEAEAEAEDDAQKLDEWANDAGKNGTDTTFEQDIDFMTKVISGGLNKQKSTGQSTVPVVSTQLNRLGNPMKESVDLLHDWKKLSGIK